MEFDFGDKTFNFPIKSLNYYPWLKTLLENNNNVNLTDYLQDTSNENKRYIENCLKILENYYNNQEVLLINDTNLTFTESFLSKGPYSTKGLDLEYQCLKCKKKTFKIYYNINYHNFENFDYESKICLKCGLIFNKHLKKISNCIQPDQCIHNWN